MMKVGWILTGVRGQKQSLIFNSEKENTLVVLSKKKKKAVASPADGKTGSQLKLMQARAEDGVSTRKQHLSSLPVVHEIIQPA